MDDGPDPYRVLLDTLGPVWPSIQQLPTLDARHAAFLERCELAYPQLDDGTADNLRRLMGQALSEGGIGAVGVMGLVKTKCSSALVSLTNEREAKDRFDEIHGTTTASIFEQFQLPERIPAERVHASRCHPSPIGAVNMALRALPRYGVDYEDWVFIDVGSGLGRNLLLASEFPFRKVVGIEIAQHLHQIACDNVARYASPTQRCKTITPLHVDALEYELPASNLVLYFWEPFSETVAEPFIERVVHAIETKGIEVRLLFLRAPFDVMAQTPRLHRKEVLTSSDLAEIDTYFAVTVYSS